MPYESSTLGRSDALLKTADVADLLGLTPRTVRKLAAAGEFPRIRLGHRSPRYRLADVEAFIARRTTTSNADAENVGAATTSDSGARNVHES